MVDERNERNGDSRQGTMERVCEPRLGSRRQDCRKLGAVLPDRGRTILVGPGTERTSAMVRLRTSLAALVLSAGASGCSFAHNSLAHYSLFHCDSCDDFPTPAYGPGFSLMPGTYTGVTPRGPEAATPITAPTPNSGVPGRVDLPAAAPTSSTPPTPPVVSPPERPGAQ
jgi:hypothetical protein